MNGDVRVNSSVAPLLPNRESGSRPGTGCRAPELLWPRLTLSEIRIRKANLREHRGKPRHLGNSPGLLHGVNPCVVFPQRTISSPNGPRTGDNRVNSRPVSRILHGVAADSANDV